MCMNESQKQNGSLILVQLLSEYLNQLAERNPTQTILQWPKNHAPVVLTVGGSQSAPNSTTLTRISV